jgi:hypothetical protein
MKRVVSSAEVPHLWMHQSQDEGRNGNGSLWFEGPTIYSYGKHFPIARHVKNKRGESAVLLTTGCYSKTTSQHIGSVRQAIPDTCVVLNVPNPANSPRVSFGALSKALAAQSKALPGIKGVPFIAKHYRELRDLIENANALARFFGYARRFDLDKLSAFAKISDEYDAALNVRRIEKRAADSERRAARNAADKAEFDEKLAAWLAGEPVRLPYWNGTAYLRVEGAEVVTSQGARFPVDHARRCLTIVRKIRERGESYHRNGTTIHLGVYKLDSMDVNGTIVAGCHRVEWSEVERFGNVLESLERAS